MSVECFARQINLVYRVNNMSIVVQITLLRRGWRFWPHPCYSTWSNIKQQNRSKFRDQRVRKSRILGCKCLHLTTSLSWMSIGLASCKDFLLVDFNSLSYPFVLEMWNANSNLSIKHKASYWELYKNQCKAFSKPQYEIILKIAFIS